MDNRTLLANRNVIAWLLLFAALALHVLDEAVTGFLPFYNHSVLVVRERLGFFPAPTFSFGIWLGGLITGILLGFGATPLVQRGGNVIRRVAVLLSALMIANALGHLVGSLYFHRILPGAYSSPILLLTALVLLFYGIRGNWQRAQTPHAVSNSTAATD